jgi:replicative DNA helicase
LNKKAKVKRTLALYRDMLEIIDVTEKRETIELPVTFKNKLDCLKKMLDMLMEGRDISNIVDSVLFSEKYRQYAEFIEYKMTERINDEVLVDTIHQVRLRKKVNALFKNYDQLHNILESIRTGSFESIDDVTLDYEQTIKQLYTNMMEEGRNIRIEASSSLDLAKDDFVHVLDMIKKKHEYINSTPTGFRLLDSKEIMPAGGFEPSRLYVIGGGSGSGKSTLINNFIYKSAMGREMTLEATPIVEVEKTKDINKVYIYITMENTIEESLMRTYQPMFNRTSLQMLDDIKKGWNIKNMIMDKIKDNNATIVMKYFPPKTMSPLDLHGVVDDVINDYGKDNIKGVYIDYLDLLKTDAKYDLYRLELGDITLSLKSMAVEYNIPVITASQLGRGVYRVKHSNELSLDMMSESIKKVEHADFIMLLAKNDFKSNLVHGKIGKNRNGGSNISLDYMVDFTMFKFLNVSVSQQENKQTCSTTTVKSGDNKALNLNMY